ncbi:plasmid stabilization system protein ParE [Neorhizobium galegae]|uniref:type II toxin-antitoxin system RelE/ParE family toxin n=1 Tax=Neorhizobium galegae TaxID=399 RepID=UPI001AE70505|nr:plasmid stabilization system protein ParE [Neorhizobium galegae]
MKRYVVRLMPEAETDLLDIYLFVRERSGSAAVATSYLARIRRFLAALETGPHRGTVRRDVREGLRVIGFERAISVAFIVENDSIVILRLAYRGHLIDLKGS